MSRSRFGSVRRRPSGGWQVRYRDNNGQDHYRMFRSKQEADGFLSSQHADITRGDWINPESGKMTLQEWSVSWMVSKRKLRPNTRSLYDYLLRLYLVPEFGRRSLRSITTDDVEKWLTKLEDTTDLSPSTINRAFRLLSQLLSAAVQRRLIAFNPTEGVHPPKDTNYEPLFLTPKQVKSLAEGINPHFKTFVLTAVYSGLRWGELAGLQVHHLNLQRRTITVRQQLTKSGDLAELKTESSRRVVTLPEWLIPYLKEEVDGRDPTDFVFTAVDGGPLNNPSNFNRRFWRPAVKRSLPEELHSLRFHDLRHTAVALAIAAGTTNPKALQTRMGHSTIRMTFDRYGHLLPGTDQEIADRLPDPFH
jgi:integrase